MKKLVLITLILFAWANICLAAGTVSGTVSDIQQGDSIAVTLSCTGDSSDGSIPDTEFGGPGTDITKNLHGYYLYEVKIVPGGTGPTDDSDLYIKDANGIDLLGGEGVNKVDNATNSHFQPVFFSRIDSKLTLDVDNNSEASSTYTITLIFAK